MHTRSDSLPYTFIFKMCGCMRRTSVTGNKLSLKPATVETNADATILKSQTMTVQVSVERNRGHGTEPYKPQNGCKVINRNKFQTTSFMTMKRR